MKKRVPVEIVIGEIWKDVYGFEGLYQISSLGRVKANSRFALDKNRKPTRFLPERLMKIYFKSQGSPIVRLRRGIKREISFDLRELVASHFIDNYKFGLFIINKDGNKLNNSVDNLVISNVGNNLPVQIEIVNDPLIWKEVKGYGGRYSVSIEGKVKNRKALLKTAIDKYGYEKVQLCKDGQGKCFKIHRLVALHFLPNPDGKEFVNHLDHDKLNNRVENLEWVNHAENMCHHFSKDRHRRKSRYVGLIWKEKDKVWLSRVKVKGKYVYVKEFKNEEEAYEARKKFIQDNGIQEKYL